LPALPRPTVQIVGAMEHADFREMDALLRADARQLSCPPELIVIAQVRPGAIDAGLVQQLRQAAPLAGIVVVAGSWCEGELRTGRPIVGVTRLYCYEFPAWWRQQMLRRDAGLCPLWFPSVESGSQAPRDRSLRVVDDHSGVIALAASNWETAEALADVFHEAGFATVWEPAGRAKAVMHNVAAGVWNGGQLDEREEFELSKFCLRMSARGAPVITLLDFPRRDCVERALAGGSAAVLGTPWVNANLLSTVDDARGGRRFVAAERRVARAA